MQQEPYTGRNEFVSLLLLRLPDMDKKLVALQQQPGSPLGLATTT